MFPTAPDLGSILAVDCGLLLGMFLLTRLLDPASASDRLLFGGTTAGLLIVYLAWRWHDTLPPLDLSGESLWSHLFFTFELAAILYTLLSIVILFKSRDRTAAADAAQLQLEKSGEWPAADIFICTYDEPLDVLERSILTALAMDYPDATVWVLDDTRRSWLRDYCSRVGARYVTRPDNIGAKAGNLNNALRITAAATNAPVILVLDADFATDRQFLRRTVGLLNDPQIAVVQTPQHYFNADPIQHNLMAQHSWVDDQRFFFDVFQPAKDAWGCAFCVGTSFIVRRKYLEEIGGVPSQAVSEDINLTYTLLSKGYKTIWLNEKLSYGLAAEGVGEYITQRARWCLGTIQVALLPEGPLRGRNFTFTERWQYFHGLMNWLCRPFILLFLIAPSIYWFFGLPAFQADYLSFLRYGMPALVGQIAYTGWISRARTLPLFSEATNAVSALAITATLLSAAVKPFGRPFKVTDKGGDRTKPKINGKLACTFGALALSSFLSITWAFISPYGAGEISSLDFFNLMWAAIAMVIGFIAFMACFERPRNDQSFALNESTFVGDADRPVPCQLTSLSVATAQISIDGNDYTVCNRPRLMLQIAEVGWLEAAIISTDNYGVQLRIEPSFEQRRELLLRLFPSADTGVADQASMSTTLLGVWRRGLGRH